MTGAYEGRIRTAMELSKWIASLGLPRNLSISCFHEILILEAFWIHLLKSFLDVGVCLSYVIFSHRLFLFFHYFEWLFYLLFLPKSLDHPFPPNNTSKQIFFHKASRWQTVWKYFLTKPVQLTRPFYHSSSGLTPRDRTTGQFSVPVKMDGFLYLESFAKLQQPGVQDGVSDKRRLEFNCRCFTPWTKS